MIAMGWVLARLGGCAPDVPHPVPPDVPAAEPLPVLRTVRYSLDPTAGDPAVPARLGGPGFPAPAGPATTGRGWQTRLDVTAVADPTAPQGGEVVLPVFDWPATLRVYGENNQQAFNHELAPLLYETLLDLDPATLAPVPRLATHWEISEDGRTFRFRLNPAARFSDGSPLTADDVAATLRLAADPTLRDPSGALTWGAFEPAVVVSKYIVEIRARRDDWRSFLDIATSLPILSAAELEGLDGAAFVDRFQVRYPVASGPYRVRPEDIDVGNGVTVTRRADWWGEDNPVWDGWYNIGRFRYVVIRDPRLRFERLKKHEIDLLSGVRPEWWAEEVGALDTVRRGLLVRRELYTDAPQGLRGFAINTGRAPLDDVRVRKALQHLLDRDLMIEKLLRGEVSPLVGYYQGGLAGRSNVPPIPYDEIAAVRLLEEAGFRDKGADGIRIRDGRPLALTLTYRDPLSERVLTVYQEACRRAGIRLDLQLLTPASLFKNLQDRAYELAEIGWAGQLFPSPGTMWRAELADQPGSNNVTALRDPAVDALCTAYDRERDPQARARILADLDAALLDAAPYVLTWAQPALRDLYWNRFGMPPWATQRFARDRGSMFFARLWWVDPELDRALAAAERDQATTLPVPPVAVRFWPRWAARENR
jgi:microcin C transport system substrate-binding protein